MLYELQQATYMNGSVNRYAYGIYFPALMLFIVTSNLASMPDHELKKPVKLTSPIFIFSMALLGALTMIGLYASLRPTPLFSSHAQPSPLLDSMVTDFMGNPLLILLLCVYMLLFQWRKMRDRLKRRSMQPPPATPLNG